MLIATWNLNNRVGTVPFRPEAADAAIALQADVLVFNEYYPQGHSAAFANSLKMAGWQHQEMSKDTGVKANRVLIASRLPLKQLDLKLPDFDQQFPANLLCVTVPANGISIIGVRVPWYAKETIGLACRSWDWIVSTAASLVDSPAIILGDLNAGLKSSKSRGGDHLRSILLSGWHRAIPQGPASFISDKGHTSEIDHILGTSACQFSEARYVTCVDQHILAGTRTAISDHAALIARVEVCG